LTHQNCVTAAMQPMHTQHPLPCQPANMTAIFPAYPPTSLHSCSAASHTRVSRLSLQVAWDDRSAAFRARVRLPAAANSQGGLATLTLQPAVANAALETRGTLEYFAPPVIAAVNPSRATVDGRTSAVGGRSIAVAVRGLPLATRPEDLAVSFVQEGGRELVCDGEACSLVQVALPLPCAITVWHHLLQIILSHSVGST
jgi:hypothetical protein